MFLCPGKQTQKHDAGEEGQWSRLLNDNMNGIESSSF